RSITRFAAKLSDLDAKAHAELAKMASEANRTDTEREELSAAARIAPANALYAAKRACALAPTGKPRALDACERAERMIDFGDPDDEEAAEALAEAHEELAGALTKDVEAAGARAHEIRGRLPLAQQLEVALNAKDRIRALRALL